MEFIETAFSNGVTTITLADDERRNALSGGLIRELVACIDEIENDPEVRVVVLTNSGSVFCAGANLKEMSQVGAVSSGESVLDVPSLLKRILHSSKPFVGRIAGHCIAGGVGLAAVLDISVAIDTATFGFSEVRVGVAPAMISVVCLPKMRLADAKASFLRGNRFLASEAVDMGIINKAVTLGDLDGEVTSIVNDLLAGEPRAIAVAKTLTTTVPTMGMDDAFNWTKEQSAALFDSDAAREGMNAFFEKRPANWMKKN
jgi:methylglutaconyl-CoA hydratase